MGIWEHEAEAYDDHVRRGEEYDPRSYYHGSPKCRYCGKLFLHWKHVDGAWRLYDGQYPHTCTQYFERQR